MKKLIRKFESLKGATFISINNYVATSSGEIANHVINVNISIENAKKTDLQKLQNCTDNDLINIADATKIAVDTLKISLSEMLESATKNLSAKLEDRTAQSQAQTDAYISLTPAIKLNKDNMSIYIFGQAISKTVLLPGTYKSVNSSPKTLGKNAIKKHLDLRSDKFRTFILGNAEMLKVDKTTIFIV